MFECCVYAWDNGLPEKQFNALVKWCKCRVGNLVNGFLANMCENPNEILPTRSYTNYISTNQSTHISAESIVKYFWTISMSKIQWSNNNTTQVIIQCWSKSFLNLRFNWYFVKEKVKWRVNIVASTLTKWWPCWVYYLHHIEWEKML